MAGVGIHNAIYLTLPEGKDIAAETFSYLAREVGRRQFAFLNTREYRANGCLGPDLKREFGGVYIANEQFTFETANEVLAKGEADAVAFGKLFIANPDLPRRFTESAPLNQPEPTTFLLIQPLSI
jgi:2,4-dienoyl-CoA reductase-like NADH-dependent reductase (Old Yellow Enzyme family)